MRVVRILFYTLLTAFGFLSLAKVHHAKALEIANCTDYGRQWRITSVNPQTVSGSSVRITINGYFPQIETCGRRNFPWVGEMSLVWVFRKEASIMEGQSYQYRPGSPNNHKEGRSERWEDLSCS